MDANILIMLDSPFIALIVIFVLFFLFYFMVLIGIFKIIGSIVKALSNDRRRDYGRY
ncbi:hypothetical protein Bind_3719 (plasmid) [Beijerinckia indica subsp. indica ATCC 9039]|uniref:Uncharacterized protein n=1 Tax=Beijerinckia indica subsp. indica (strain ATCC 9039 / DSM 1715 / NCIMB 8712) TaxID=395963 RepID=B2IL71_BEII9|nr:hypothetical protein Bind_3719 [Beijerinckia indica subsp. indica ATCC 9039]